MQVPQGWTASDGQLLRDLRERSGLDRGSFARACTLSIAQLTELEEGGHGRFYSDRIKSHTGRSLLKKLGHVQVAPVKADPAPGLPEDPPGGGEAAGLGAPVVAARPPAPAPAPVEVEVKGAALRNPWPLRAGIAVAAVATLAVILMPRTPREPRVAADMAQAQRPASLPADAASRAPADPSASAVPAPPAAEAAPAAAATVAVASHAASPEGRSDAAAAAMQARCDTPPRDQAVAYTPPSALRPNNYVYIESTGETSVCVVDSQNRQTVSVVRPGESASVYGTPPFMVQSRQWAALRVFYQGTRVTLDTATPPLAVMLNPR